MAKKKETEKGKNQKGFWLIGFDDGTTAVAASKDIANNEIDAYMSVKTKERLRTPINLQGPLLYMEVEQQPVSFDMILCDKSFDVKDFVWKK